jgi:predicted phosphoribosyltransferase
MSAGEYFRQDYKPIFRSRHEAGRRLAELLSAYRDQPDVLVLALPRGGVPVAYEIARALNAPLDIFLVRKLGVPGHEELAMGALASGDIRVVNTDIVNRLGISEAMLDIVAAHEKRELDRRQLAYRGSRRDPVLTGRTVILVDDGLATGSTMRAAAEAIKEQNPATVIVAVPVAAEQTCAELGQEVDEIICAATPDPFYGVGLWYEDFAQTSDDEVRALLTRSARHEHSRHTHKAA